MRALTSAILGGVLVASALSPALADSQSPAAIRAAAPLDEYFGPLRMSPLGIRNDLASENAQLDAGVADQATLLKHVALVERAIHDWEAHYPGDGWLPDAIANLHTVYAKAAGRDAKLRAIDAATWLIARYPASDEAKAMRDDLASAMFDDSDSPSNDPNTSPGEVAPPAEATLTPSVPAVPVAAVPTTTVPAVAVSPATKTASAWQRFHAARASSH
jgi:hypothetical protein